METLRDLTLPSSGQLTLFAAASPARTYPWLDAVRDWLANEAPSSGISSASSVFFALHGCFSKTFPDYSVASLVETSWRSSVRWMNSGMVWRGAFWTASISEWPSDGAVCSLSDVLESHVPLRFYLSPRACAGILRRAAKRGRTLPPALEVALTAVVEMGETSPLLSEKTPAALDRDGTPATHSQGTTPGTRTKLPTSSKTPEARGTSGSTGSGSPEEAPATSLTESASTPLPSPRTNKAKSKPPTSALSSPLEAASQGKDTRPLLVRRLTPTECEALQGFPRDWTLLPLTRPDTGHSGMP